jgi:hypothetical protein
MVMKRAGFEQPRALFVIAFGDHNRRFFAPPARTHP